jgi:hypothetical protein
LLPALESRFALYYKDGVSRDSIVPVWRLLRRRTVKFVPLPDLHPDKGAAKILCVVTWNADCRIENPAGPVLAKNSYCAEKPFGSVMDEKTDDRNLKIRVHKKSTPLARFQNPHKTAANQNMTRNVFIKMKDNEKGLHIQTLIT